MLSQKLKKSKRLFSYLLKDTSLRWGRILHYVIYLFLCTICSLWINLGSAGLEPADRMASKRFIPVWIGTVLLLLVYAILIKYIHTALVTRQRFSSNTKLNFIIYFVYALCIILAIHGLILEVLLPDKPGLVLLSYAYLSTDFWFFFPVVLLYTLFIHKFPEWALIQWPPFSQMTIHMAVPDPAAPVKPKMLLLQAGSVDSARQSAGKNRDSFVQIGSSGTAALPDAATPLDPMITQADETSLDPLLILWQCERNRPALMVYLLRQLKEEELSGQKTIKCLQAVIIVKEQRSADVYRHDGKFCRIDVTTKVLQANPWLVKISAKVYVNMLYFRVPVNRPTELELNESIRSELQRLLPEKRFKKLVTPSRALSSNLNEFWGILKTLDETKLDEEFNLV
ncbi:hypothetical protein [Sphingobacterium sp. HMA12]|uniref:hypothetical protein n=1 Tax=Sphingobacterium sp. HMA12 TaxID=2050894 RepID=UPI00131540E7|nr:hypothetical protein [Sphingobacterium sp. HMA12]